jgi:hypothetical protein
MAQRVLEAIEQAGTNFVESVAQLLPRAVVTLSIIVVGWFIAIMLKWLTRWVLGRVGFNTVCERFELAALLKAAGLPSAEALASAAVFWIVWIGFLLSGVDVLGFAVLQGLVDGFALFVPRLLVALAILAIGYVLANVAWRATVLAAVNARVPSPRLLSGAVRALILILAAAMALDQIAVARTIVLTAFAIAFGAVMLGLAIAFGVGGGGIARRILDHWFPERDAPEDEVKHL